MGRRPWSWVVAAATTLLLYLGAVTGRADAWGVPSKESASSQRSSLPREVTSSGGHLNVELTVAPWVQVCVSSLSS